MRVYEIDCSTADYRLDRYSFDKHIAGKLDPLRDEYRQLGNKPPEIDVFNVDATGVREADSYGCLALVLLCRQLRERVGGKVNLSLPHSGRFVQEFRDGGFLAMVTLEAQVEGADEPEEEASPRNRMYAAGRITSRKDLTESIELLARARSAASQEKDGSDSWRRSYLTIVRIAPFLTIGLELGQNVLEHSQLGTDRRPEGYLSFCFSHSAIEISVMDLGIGIPASLGFDSEPSSSIEAIRLACEMHGTSKEADGRGLGLYLTTKKVIECGGEMSIRSGRANVVFNSTNKYMGEQAHGSATPFFSGTQIHLLLPLIDLKPGVDDGIEEYDF